MLYQILIVTGSGGEGFSTQQVVEFGTLVGAQNAIALVNEKGRMADSVKVEAIALFKEHANERHDETGRA